MNNKKILFFLCGIELILLLPIINYFTYGNSDPFVSHSIVSAYTLSRTATLKGASNLLTSPYLTSHINVWTWQSSTALMIDNLIIGAPLLLYSIGAISNIPFDLVGNSPIPYFIYFTLFLLIIRRIWKLVNRKDALVWTATITSIILFSHAHVIPKFLSFQYHAVALVYYLSIILIFLIIIEKKNIRYNYILCIVILYIAMIFTHYRFPILIILDLMILTVAWFFLGIIHSTTSAIHKLIVYMTPLFILFLFLSPFYWTYISHNFGSLSKELFTARYIKSLLGIGDGSLHTTSLANEWYLAYWKGSQYIEGLTFVIYGLLLILWVFQKSRQNIIKITPRDTLFLWSYGSTITYFIYYLAYEGSIGINIYELFFLPIFSLVLLEQIKKEKTKVKGIVLVLLSLIIMSSLANASFSWYYNYTYEIHPIQSELEAKNAFPFILTHSGERKVVGSSFVVSAALYRYSAKEGSEYLTQVPSRIITNEVLEYHKSGDLSMFIENMDKKNDYFILTSYEIKHGLSTDVTSGLTYLMPDEVKRINTFLSCGHNIIFNSGNSKVFLLS